MKLNFNQDLTCDEGRRIISGKIVPFDNEIGYTSAGKVIFQKNSIAIHETAKVKLLLEHDPKQPIGRAVNFTTTDEGIFASFKIAETTRGNDSLVEASQDLRSGLSVGVEVIASQPKDGILYISSARLIETSLVQAAAFDSAAVISVAASEPEPELVEENPETQPTESEASVSDNATPVTPEVEAAKVEASRPTAVTAMAYSEVRSPIKSKATYLQHTIKAQLGNDDSRDYVRAADAQAANVMNFADDSFTTNPAFNPVQYVGTVVDTLIGSRPLIDAFGGSKALPASGMTISIPKITTSGTVAQTAEAAAPSETGIVSAYVNATVVKMAGLQRYSVELLERSQDNPAFFQAMLENMQRAYNKASDSYVVAEATSGGTQATATAASSAGIISFVSTEAPAAYLAAGEVATAYVAGSSQWSLLMSSVDTTGRPIYNAGSPYNSGGSAIPTSLRGNVLGLDFYVDPNMVSTTIDESAFIIVPSSMYIAESPVLRLSTNIPTSGEIETMLYGYIAAKTLVSGGIRRFNLT
jgi:HK97 family phage prohead protease